MKYKRSKRVFVVSVSLDPERRWGHIIGAGGSRVSVWQTTLRAMGFAIGETKTRLLRHDRPVDRGFVIHRRSHYIIQFGPNEIALPCVNGFRYGTDIRMKVGETRFYTLERVVE